MQSFCFFESRLRHFLQSQKKWGVYPKGTLRRGIVHANNKKDKNFIVLFPAARGADFVKEPKSAIVFTLYFGMYKVKLMPIFCIFLKMILFFKKPCSYTLTAILLVSSPFSELPKRYNYLLLILYY